MTDNTEAMELWREALAAFDQPDRDRPQAAAAIETGEHLKGRA